MRSSPRQLADLLGIERGRDRRCRREADGPFVEAHHVAEHCIDQRADDLDATRVEIRVDAVDLGRLERLAGCLGPFGQLRRRRLAQPDEHVARLVGSTGEERVERRVDRAVLRPPDGERFGGESIDIDLVALAVERHAVHVTCGVNDLGRRDPEVELGELRCDLGDDGQARWIHTEPLGDDLDRRRVAFSGRRRARFGAGRATRGAEQGGDHDDRRHQPARDQVTWGMGSGHAALLRPSGRDGLWGARKEVR